MSIPDPMEARRTLRICNAHGLHARPCHAIVSTALEFESELRVAHGAHEVNGKSILELMTLNASCDTELRFVARGTDAESLLEALAALVDSGFSETA